MVEEGSTVALEYTLKLEDDTTVHTNVGGEPLTYTQGGREILPALEEALLGQKAGSSLQVKLAAEQAYGPVIQEAFQEVDLGTVPEDARKVGTVLSTTDSQGQRRQLRVHEVRESTIVLDFNHPLAGEALTFDLKILAVR